MSTEKITIEVLTQRVEVLEKQVQVLMSISKPLKNPKKIKNIDPDEPPKKKRVSGYILFGNDQRPKLKDLLLKDGPVKSTDLMKKIALLWNNLEPKLKNEWNLKANS